MPMNLFSVLKSLDELLYEVMSWLVFFPITLGRIIRHPLDMMNYSDVEQRDAESDQYSDTLTPPLLLLLALIISHALEIALVGQNGLIANKQGLAGFISNDTNLIALRIVLFSLFPLAMSVRLVRGLHLRLDRETLKAPFYSQCYAAALFALGTGLAMLLIVQDDPAILMTGLALQIVVLGWYGILQTLWFSRHLQVSKLRGFGQASWAMIEASLAAIFVAFLFA
jgi:hypothetical protein